jgi:zinc D-Ala-D-Ala dipeptidase
MTGLDQNASRYGKDTLLGATLRAGIKVLERMGGPSGGESYRAEYPSGLEVTITVLSAVPQSPEFAAQLQHLRRMVEHQHPNVPRVLDIGETEDGRLYVVAETLQGELLSQVLARRGSLPQGKALDLFRQAAAGLEAVHAAGWIHGNLSPQTILLSRTGGRTVVKLIRFSSPLRSGQQRDQRAEQEGSADYASPERVAGGETDERSDVYSLGAVLHHLLTGVPPPRPSAQPAGAPASAADRIPERIRPALDRALDPSPAERFQTVAEFVTAIASPEDRKREPRHTGRRLGAAAAALAGIWAGVWLLWDGPLLTQPEFTRPSAQESGAVPPAAARDEEASAEPPAPAPPRTDALSAADPVLVDVRSIDSTIRVDLRYATANNFTGAPLPGYEVARALLRREPAAALGRVQARLRGRGLGLKVYDAYRPVRASRAMVDWAERTGRNTLVERGYISERTRHNLGVAVDLTLVDLGTGRELPAGLAMDNFSAAAAEPADTGGEALRARQILADAMKSEGFTPYDRAWYHFNYPLPGAVPLDRVIR